MKADTARQKANVGRLELFLLLEKAIPFLEALLELLPAVVRWVCRRWLMPELEAWVEVENEIHASTPYFGRENGDAPKHSYCVAVVAPWSSERGTYMVNAWGVNEAIDGGLRRWPDLGGTPEYVAVYANAEAYVEGASPVARARVTGAIPDLNREEIRWTWEEDDG